MTDAERHAQWQDPFIQELMADLKATIYSRYLHRRKISPPRKRSIQDEVVSAGGETATDLTPTQPLHDLLPGGDRLSA